MPTMILSAWLWMAPRPPSANCTPTCTRQFNTAVVSLSPHRCRQPPSLALPVAVDHPHTAATLRNWRRWLGLMRRIRRINGQNQRAWLDIRCAARHSDSDKDALVTKTLTLHLRPQCCLPLGPTAGVTTTSSMGRVWCLEQAQEVGCVVAVCAGKASDC